MTNKELSQLLSVCRALAFESSGVMWGTMRSAHGKMSLRVARLRHTPSQTENTHTNTWTQTGVLVAVQRQDAVRVVRLREVISFFFFFVTFTPLFVHGQSPFVAHDTQPSLF